MCHYFPSPILKSLLTFLLDSFNTGIKRMEEGCILGRGVFWPKVGFEFSAQVDPIQAKFTKEMVGNLVLSLFWPKTKEHYQVISFQAIYICPSHNGHINGHNSSGQTVHYYGNFSKTHSHSPAHYCHTFGYYICLLKQTWRSRLFADKLFENVNLVKS